MPRDADCGGDRGAAHVEGRPPAVRALGKHHSLQGRVQGRLQAMICVSAAEPEFVRLLGSWDFCALKLKLEGQMSASS